MSGFVAATRDQISANIQNSIQVLNEKKTLRLRRKLISHITEFSENK